MGSTGNLYKTSERQQKFYSHRHIRDIYKYIEFIRAFFLWLTKKDVLKRSIPLDYEIYGEKRHADSAIEMYLYVMEKILTKNAAPLDRQQIRDLYTTVDCFYDCSKLIANGNFDGNTEEMVQFIKKRQKTAVFLPVWKDKPSQNSARENL